MTPNSKLPIATVSIMSGLPAVLTEFAWSMIQFVDFNSQYVCGPKQFIHYSRSRHSLHFHARNQMVDEMLGDHLLMLDSDHLVPCDLLARLLNAAKMFRLDVVTGLYLKKEPPYRPAAWKWTENSHAELADIPNEVFEIGAAGAGCLLVHRRVFDRIKTEMKEEPFSVQEFPGVTGEDFAFFKRLRMLGIPAACVPWIECNHLLVKPLRADEDFQRGVALPGEQEESIRSTKFVQQEVAA